MPSRKAEWKTSNRNESSATMAKIQKFYTGENSSSDPVDLFNFEAHLTLAGEIQSSINQQFIDEFTMCLWLQFLNPGYFEIVYMPADFQAGADVTFAIGRNITLEMFGNSRTVAASVLDGLWNHVCITWSKKGIYEVTKNGKIEGFGKRLVNGEHQSIPGYGTVVARFNTIQAKKLTKAVIGKLSGLNIWSSVQDKENIKRFSVGCGYENGDLLQWHTLAIPALGVSASVQTASCRHGQRDYLFFHGDSPKEESVAIVSSPWQPRTSNSPLHCLKFRYLVYGPETNSLEVFHKYRGQDHDTPIWIATQTRKDVWMYGQVPVGSLDEFQVTVKAQVRGTLGCVAIAEPYILKEGCEHFPAASFAACSMTLTNSSGYITSPYYPGNTPSNFHCTWRIRLPKYHVVRLNILTLDLMEHSRCQDGFLQIKDGVHLSSPSLGRFCGNKFPTVIDSSSNEVEIEYMSRFPKSRFKILYYTKKKSQDLKHAATCRRRRACPVGCVCSAISGHNDTLLIQGQDIIDMPSKLPVEAAAVIFSGNRVTSIEQTAFGNKLVRLKYLDLGSNRLFQISESPFRSLISLEYLRLNRNFLKTLESGVFTGLGNLHVLDLGVNLLELVPVKMLMPLSRLRVLSLRSNRISKLHPDLFNNTWDLTYLFLQDNRIRALQGGTFSTLTKLKVLYLNNNSIERLSKDALQGLTSLEILHLEGNEITHMDSDAFNDLQNLKKLNLDEFIYCCYASAAVPDLQCDSPGNEFSSCDDLMKSAGLRACLWVLGILAFLGNISVILWRTTLGKEHRVHSFLLINLAASDLLMGIYLLIIAIKDAQWQGEYFKHDIEWRESFVCQLAGALSMLSSEVSVLMLTLITMDRLICIVFPFSRARLTWKKAYASCGFIWVFGCVISCLPMMEFEYFRDERNRAGFYGRSSVCLPLQLSEGKPAGWEYSISFYLVLNLLAFILIVVTYVVIFWSVKKSSGSIRSTKMNQDAAMARKMMFIILTDFCCWMPVIVMGILSLTGNFHDPEKTAYVITAVFVLPVNSSINPILYTFSAINIRQAMAKNAARTGNRFIALDDMRRRRLNKETGANCEAGNKML